MTKKRQASEPVQTKTRKWDCPLGRLATAMLHQNHREVRRTRYCFCLFKQKKIYFLFALFCSQLGRALWLCSQAQLALQCCIGGEPMKLFKNFQTSHAKISVYSSASHYTKLGFFPIYLDNLLTIKKI